VALSEKIDSHSVGGSIFCDETVQEMVRSSPSWRDNMLSAGRGGGVRSPLSVIGRSPCGRRMTKGAVKAAVRGGDIASAKKAVAELMAAVDMHKSKDSSSPRPPPKQLGLGAEETALNSADQQTAVEADGPNNARSAECLSVEGIEMERKQDGDVQEDVFDDDENKENVFRGFNADEIVEITDDFDTDKVVGDTLEQLNRQARTLRRRSQLSTDSFEYENILQQLQLVRQRQAELEQLQVTLRSKLLHCRPTPADEQPLNLKLNSASESQQVDQLTVEPLDLRIPSVRQDPTEHGRIVLADITRIVVGDADPNDCFEVPDSPLVVTTDAENDDADKTDGDLLCCENSSCDRDNNARRVEADKDIVESTPTPLRSSPDNCNTAGCVTSHSVGILDQYLASLNVSDISEAETLSPCAVASPDVSSEFSNYQMYQRLLDTSMRCFDPIAAVLTDGDDQVCDLQ